MLDTGRVNQKRRTRQAIVDAAQRLLSEGVTPTVAEAAAAAEVGRTTAYRYFPTQDSLLVELTVSAGVSDVEELVGRPVDAGGSRDRLLEVVRALNAHVLDEEVRYRTAVRLYQEQWLAAHADGDDSPVVREGRRRRWISTVLEPAMEEAGLPPAERNRLVAALGLLTGAEAMLVLRDVSRLDAGSALAVTDWATRALLRAALDNRADEI
jgi:AcrR family transcriptional regulator